MANTTKWKIIQLPNLCLNTSNMNTEIKEDQLKHGYEVATGTPKL
jgi:hypothetical protein